MNNKIILECSKKFDYYRGLFTTDTGPDLRYQLVHGPKTHAILENFRNFFFLLSFCFETICI